MPFRPKHSLLNIDVEKMHTIDTRSVENLFGMWSVFSKTSDALEDGKRLENLSWRLWNRETFCCCPETQARSTLSPQCAFPLRAKSGSISKVPELASSIDSGSTEESDDDETLSSLPLPSSHTVRPELRRIDSCESRSRGREKHITPVDLEKIVISIKEKKSLEPLSPLPLAVLSTEQLHIKQERSTKREQPAAPTVTEPEVEAESSDIATTTPVQRALPFGKNLESSTSTVATSGSNDSQPSQTSDSSATAMSTHNIVRGFVPGGAPSSYRSQTHLAAQPTPILKSSSQYRHDQAAKKKGAMFTLGTSSGEDESSLDSHMYKNSVSSLSEALHRPKKQAFFRDDASMAKAAQDSPVFESDDDDDDEISESAIEEEDEDSSDWEDEMNEEQSSMEEQELFQRVGSRPNLTSRRSLLTSLMHEPDRARALANAASRSTPAIRRSRTASPQTSSMASSPQAEPQQVPSGLAMSRAKPIIMTTSNTHQLALSPRTTRRNMLSTELTESLRKNLLWERQHKSSQNIAALKRRHTSQDVKNLKQYPEPPPILSTKENVASKFSNEFFHAGLQEYHARGW